MEKKLAETKVCPFMEQILPIDDGIYNPEPKNIYCITDNCMAWIKVGFMEENEQGYCKLIDEKGK